MSAVCSLSSVFSDFIAKCNTNLTVYAQLEPLQDYRWIITDKFDAKYEGSITTDENGFFDIATSDLPEHLLNSYAGNFLLQIQDTTCKPIKFKVASEYQAISFSVKQGNYVKDFLGCPFTCAGVTGEQSRLFEFTNEPGDFEIDYDPLLAAYGNAPLIQVYHETTPDSGEFEKVTVDINQLRINGTLDTISVNNAGFTGNGYVLIGG